MQKIGLFGGTFNPVHLAHLTLATRAIEALALDELYWIPSKPWQKADQKIVSGNIRAEMIELMIRDEAKMHLDRCEIDRPGDSYTIETIDDFTQRFPNAQFFLLIGTDQWKNFHTWKAWKIILEKAHVIVFSRNGLQDDCDQEVKAFLQSKKLSVDFLEMPSMAISSQEIRSIIAKEGSLSDKLAGKLPRAITNFIHTLGLYQQ